MKITQEKEFTPVTMVIETQEEFDKIYAIFNYGPITDELECMDIFSELHKLKPCISPRQEYWYKKLDELLT